MKYSCSNLNHKICSIKYYLLTVPKSGRLLVMVASDMVCLSRPYDFKLFKGCLPQILLGPFLNTLSHILVLVSRESKTMRPSCFQIICSKIFFKSYRKSSVLDLFLMKFDAVGLQLYNTRFRHKSFPVNLLKFFRTPFL